MQRKSVHLTTASSSAPIVQEAARSFHPDSNMPGCMMPDGGECCASYASAVADWYRQRKRIARLEADLHECLDYFKDHYDVVDGDYGEPSPNKEMQLGTMIQETLHGPGNF